MSNLVSSPRKRPHSSDRDPSSPRPHFIHTHLFNAKPSKRPKFVEKAVIAESLDKTNSIGQGKETGVASQPNSRPPHQLEDLHEESIGLQDAFSGGNSVLSRKIKKRIRRNPLHKTQVVKARTPPTFINIEKCAPARLPRLENSEASSALPVPETAHDPEILLPRTVNDTAEPLSSAFTEAPDVEYPTLEEKVSVPESLRSSRGQLLSYIESKMKLTAMSLRDLLSALNLLNSQEQLTSASIRILEMESYVCAGKKELFTAPKRPIQLPSVLKAEEFSHEQFLFKTWKLLRSKPAITSSNSEIHSGIWYRLISLIGRDWVAFILLNFRIYRPFRYERGTWLQLAGPDTLVESELQFGSRHPFLSKGVCITKADIMYRSSSEGALIFQGIKPENQSHFHPELLPLLNRIPKRLSQYCTLDRFGKIKVPGPISETRKWAPLKAVAKFVCHRLNKLLPISILGSKRNKVVFFESVTCWIKLPGFKKTSLKRMTRGIKLSEVPWLRNTDNCRLAKQHLERCIEWIFQFLLKPLILHHFYLTEMSGKPGSLYYFNREVWFKSISTPASKALIERLDGSSDSGSHELSTYQDDKRIPNDGSTITPAVERWRVTPKVDGTTRVIINLKSFNESLKNAHLILRHVASASHTRLDSWHNWMIRLYNYRDEVTDHGQKKKSFYLVKLDVSSCYDNAKVAKVKEIASNSLKGGRDVYRVQDVKRLCLNTGKLSNKRMAFKLPEPNRDDAETFVASPDSPHVASILLESGASSNVQGDSAMADIDRIFSDIHLKIFSRIMRYSSGIPQGSACSLDLCNIMLDDLVASKLGKFAEDPESLLLRYVDDFLFISTSEELVLEFQQAMLNDFECEYGITCNPSKMSSTCGAKNSEVRRVNFLGHDIDPKSLDVFPKDVPRRIQIPTDANATYVRNLLTYELECLLGVARAFKRASSPLPVRLLRETSRRFGVALAGGRLHNFYKLQRSKAAFTEAQVRKKVVHRYLLSLVDKKDWGLTRRLVMQSYNRETKIARNRGKLL